MPPIFKQKSKSLPQLRKRIYSKIVNQHTRQKWKRYLESEMELSQIIQELSKAQFDISNQNHLKYSARQNLQMKKEIIKNLQKLEIEEGLEKLVELSEKIPFPNEKKRIDLIIIFLEGRRIVEICLSTEKEEDTIQWLKEKIGQYLIGNEVHLIKIKILTLLSILILRFHGILMTTQQKMILFKTIELKKKKLVQLDNMHEKEIQFECLLFLLLQLYKILYLLKKDQQSILFFYNQLEAYTQVYISRQQIKSGLDVQQIEKILVNMKPTLNELDIYEDSKLRKEFAFRNIQAQITQNDHLPTNQKGERFDKKFNHRPSVQLRIRNSSNFHNKKLELHRCSEVVETVQTIQHEGGVFITEIEQNGISSSFLLIFSQKIFIVHLNITFRNACSLMDLRVNIKNEKNTSQIFEIFGIETLIDRLLLSSIGKFIEKLIGKIFHTQGQFRQLNNLSISQAYVPENMDTEHIVPALIRAKTFIKEYLKRKYIDDSVIGNKFSFPVFSLAKIKSSMEEDIKQKQGRKERGLFLKRRGQFERDIASIVVPIDQISIRMLVKRSQQSEVSFYIFNLFYETLFKGVEIYFFDNDDDPPEISSYLQKFKDIGKKCYDSHKLINKVSVIQQILKLSQSSEINVITNKEYKIEEDADLYVMETQTQTLKMKIFNPDKQHRRKTKVELRKEYEIIKTGKKNYELFLIQQHPTYYVYHNQKTKFFLSLNWISFGWKLENIRIRMYSGIKIVSQKQKKKYFLKTDKKDNSLTVKEQLIVLRLLKHHIVKLQTSGFCILLEYACPSGQFLYEIVISHKNKRYYRLFDRQIQRSDIIIDLQQLTINSRRLSPYLTGEKCLSEANQYYLHLQEQRANLCE